MGFTFQGLCLKIGETKLMIKKNPTSMNIKMQTKNILFLLFFVMFRVFLFIKEKKRDCSIKIPFQKVCFNSIGSRLQRISVDQFNYSVILRIQIIPPFKNLIGFKTKCVKF